MAINILDSMLINRISAGEVVESPFSIVKELLDNAIDAGATKITVEINNGGIDKIVVKDNGKGIDKDDLIKAFLPHATSKISTVDDLANIMTLGFRGEALASISNVSQTAVLTKTKDNDCAFTLEVNGGNFGEISATMGEDGTKFEIKNLFFNTPARRKFLKRPKQEEIQITNVMSRYIMAHPNIAFKYIVEGNTVFNTHGTNLFDAIICVYGSEVAQNIIPVEKVVDGKKLSGYVSKIGFSKPNTTYQTLILNSRYVIDETVSKAVYMAFEEYLMPRQFPFFVLNLDMPYTEVDVNVHPSKLSVRFQNPSEIYDFVFSAVRGAIFNSGNTNANYEEQKKVLDYDDIINETNEEVEIEPTANFNTSVTFKQDVFKPMSIFDDEIAKSELEQKEVSHLTEQNQVKTNNVNEQQNSISNFNVSAKQDNKDCLNNSSNAVNTEQENKTSNLTQKFVDVGNFADFKIVGQAFNEFIVLEKQDCLLLLDFHAGHERLNYDKFVKMVENREIVIQDLLVPYTQTLSEEELEFVLRLKQDLNNLGFDVEQFGENTIIINSVPMQLKDINLKSFVDDLVHDMKNFKPAMNNEIKHYLMQKACKSSVKSGMSLTEMEIKDLLKDLDLKHPVLLCPHGRPIVTVITRSQIEKWFKRIVE